MTGAFLITFKRTTAEKKLRWSMDQMHDLVARSKAGQAVVETWRFLNKSHVSIGDRVFLLLQGKPGPAIIGYGHTSGEPWSAEGIRRVPITFERMVDPMSEAFADREDLLAIREGRSLWKSQRSGVRIDPK